MLFDGKDIVRAEAVATFWWLSSGCGEHGKKPEIWSFISDESNQEAIGKLDQYMPTFRAKLTRKFEAMKQAHEQLTDLLTSNELIKLFPAIHKDLYIIQSLMYPLDKRFEPVVKPELDEMRKRSQKISNEGSFVYLVGKSSN